MADLEDSLEDALLFALDDLREENFKRFTHKLRFLKMEGKAPVPQGKLEGASTTDTVQFLLEAYGKEGAREVATHVLREINLRDSASKLQKWKYNDCKKNYKRHLRDTFQPIPELGSNWGSAVGLPQRYTALHLLRHPPPSEATHELMVAAKKQREMEPPPGGGSPKGGMENLFDSAAEETSSRTVVLFGPPGVGKTTAVRKLMLDWASGRCWQEKFEYAFYLSCRALSWDSAQTMSLVDLMLSSCPPGILLPEGILMNPDALLLILDGFDELGGRDLQSDTQSASDPHAKQTSTRLVAGLLRKKLLAPCHLLVTMRPVALGSFPLTLKSTQFVEVLGFRPAQRKEYFHHFFENKEEATWAFELVRRNETLFRICFLPAVCWIVCSILSGRLGTEPLKNIPEMATSTDVHMGLLLELLACPSGLSDLKGLCALAKEGVRWQSMVYDEEELRAHGLEPCSVSRRLLRRDLDRPSLFQFIHRGFQELFAALFYLLESDGEAAALPEDWKEVFGNQKGPHRHTGMVVRFLFGLSNAKRQSILQRAWGCCILPRTRLCQEFLSWVEQEAEHHAFRRGDQLLELCHCLYEMQDSEFARAVMGHVCNLDLQDHLSTKLDLVALSFCLSASDSPHSLRLSGYALGLPGIRQLSPGLLKSLEIQLNSCELTAAICRELVSIVVDNQNLIHLDLSENPLDDSGIIHLCERLMDSPGKLQTLRLNGCNLTSASCNALAQILASNHHLTNLELGENPLCDEGVEKLCEGLKHPQSRLQSLMLHHCGLTEVACKDLATVLEASKSLQDLGLGDNSLGDEGVRQLCAALKKSHCKFPSLSLSMRTLNRNTKRKLQAVAALHPHMNLISYYPPGFPTLPCADE